MDAIKQFPQKLCVAVQQYFPVAPVHAKEKGWKKNKNVINQQDIRRSRIFAQLARALQSPP
ncbi:MAG: hypothetical protein KDI16_11160 [Halioglobus sp.]|nr:hypothetical protein [Halioglobus sp.]